MRLPSILATLLAVLSLTLASCASTAGNDRAEVTIRYGNIYPDSTSFGSAIDDMAKRLNKTSGGRIQMEVFHDGKLGSEQSHIEAVREGSLEMAQTGTAGIGLFVPETALFERWYAFDNPQSVAEAFQRLRPTLEREYSANGFKLLGAFYNGPRSIISSKPIRSLPDMRGVQLRVPESEIYIRMANALGSRPVSLPLGDAYTGLQTGTIDAMEGSPDDLASGDYGEVAKYLTLDRHVYHPLSIVYNLEKWEKLSARQQSQIQAAVDHAARVQLDELTKANTQAMTELREEGVEVIELPDRRNWENQVADTSDEFARQFGPEGRRILTTIEHTGSENR